jgi:glyoxylase-like metal-dependent hydrolase (beta-lactamase superfamily II)
MGVAISTSVATHAHVDHVSGAAELAARTEAPFLMHSDGIPLLAAINQQTQAFGLPPVEAPEVNGYLSAGQTLQVGDLELTVHETPGHAPGHVTLVGNEIDFGGAQVPFALCGDVIFQGSIGRVDLPGGDLEQLMRSIERVILPLSDETVLFCGHGPATTVGRERDHNPFVRQWLSRWRR